MRIIQNDASCFTELVLKQVLCSSLRKFLIECRELTVNVGWGMVCGMKILISILALNS